MMGRQPCCAAEKKLRKGLWSPEEDEKLATHIARFGVSCWSSIPELAGLQRCGKSCRLRWMNYLRPDLKRGRFSQQEEELIMSLHRSLGNSWSQIAARLPGRSDNEIKNFWNARLRKKLRQEETGRKAASPRRGGGDHQRQKPVFDPFPQQVDQDQASAAGIAVRAGAAGVLAADAETVSVETPTLTSDCDGFMTAMADEASLLLGEYLDGSHDGLFWEEHVFS